MVYYSGHRLHAFMRSICLDYGHFRLHDKPTSPKGSWGASLQDEAAGPQRRVCGREAPNVRRGSLGGGSGAASERVQRTEKGPCVSTCDHCCEPRPRATGPRLLTAMPLRRPVDRSGSRVEVD